MGADERRGAAHTDVQRLIDSWTAVPALVRDRYLNVIASNELATAVSPLLTEGVNLARLALSCGGAEAGSSSAVLSLAVVAALRNSLSRFESDEQLEDLVAELSTANQAFAVAWTQPDPIPGEPAAESEEFTFANAVGEIVMSFQEWSMPNSFGLTVVVWRARDDVSAAALARLVHRSV